MLGSVVQVHLSPPRFSSKKSSYVHEPALLLVRMRVFCFMSTKAVHLHPKFLRVHLWVLAETYRTDTHKMPKLATPLLDIQPKNAKPQAKPYKLFDGGGMYLLVNPDGSKYWRMSYKFEGTERLLAFGKYPEISLANARKQRTAARESINSGIDPSQAKRIEKTKTATANANTFEAVARAWHTNRLDTWQQRTATNILHRLEKDVFPLIGKQPIASIKAPVILDVLRQIEKRGAIDMAKRQGQVCSQIFRYAIACGQAEVDPVPGLRGALKPSASGHHAAISPDDLPAFLEAFKKIEGRSTYLLKSCFD
jgi:hypothetical protein